MLHLQSTALPENTELRIQKADGIVIITSRYDDLNTISLLGRSKKIIEDYIKRGVDFNETTRGFPSIEVSYAPLGVDMSINVPFADALSLIKYAIKEVADRFR